MPPGNGSQTVKPYLKQFSLNHRPIDDIEFVHKVNVIGPLRVSQAMLPLLKKGHRKLVSIHSHARLASPHNCCILRPPLQFLLHLPFAMAWGQT